MSLKGVSTFWFKILLSLFFILIVFAGIKLSLLCPDYADSIIQGAATIALILTLLLMMFQYIDSRDPVVTFTLDPNPSFDYINGKQTMQLKVTMLNESNFDTRVWVDVNLRIDGTDSKEVGELYTGEKPWLLPGQGEIGNAVFSIYSIFDDQGKIASQDIRFNIVVKHQGYLWRTIKKLPQKWHYDKSKRIWVYDV